MVKLLKYFVQFVPFLKIKSADRGQIFGELNVPF